jgi:hypothetical protein
MDEALAFIEILCPKESYGFASAADQEDDREGEEDTGESRRLTY